MLLVTEDDRSPQIDEFPSGAIVILVIAAVAVASVVITLFCIIVHNKRRRIRSSAQTLPPIVSTRPLGMTPSPSPAASSFPPMFFHNPSVPKPIQLDAPPTYEEAMSVPCSPNPIVPPSSPPPFSEVDEQQTAHAPTRPMRTNHTSAASLPPEDQPSTSSA